MTINAESMKPGADLHPPPFSLYLAGKIHSPSDQLRFDGDALRLFHPPVSHLPAGGESLEAGFAGEDLQHLPQGFRALAL